MFSECLLMRIAPPPAYAACPHVCVAWPTVENSATPSTQLDWHMAVPAHAAMCWRIWAMLHMHWAEMVVAQERCCSICLLHSCKMPSWERAADACMRQAADLPSTVSMHQGRSILHGMVTNAWGANMGEGGSHLAAPGSRLCKSSWSSFCQDMCSGQL